MDKYIYVPHNPTDRAVDEFFISLLKESGEIKFGELKKSLKRGLNFSNTLFIQKKPLALLACLTKSKRNAGFFSRSAGKPFFFFKIWPPFGGGAF